MKVHPIRDPEKIKIIKMYLRVKNPRDYLLFTLGINFALRIGDLLKLKVKDVLNRNGKILKNLTVYERRTKRLKKIRINEASREALKYYFQKTNCKRDDYLFKGKRSQKPISRIYVYRKIKEWCEDFGITDIRIGTHTLRKTWGYHARKYHNVPLELIQEKLGHRSLKETRKYIGIIDDEIKDVEKQVNL